MLTLTARWLFPVSRPPLSGGTITIEGDRIIAVESSGRRRADLDLGDVALLPGLVNAHTHLDLSGLRGKCPPTRVFPDWLRSVVAARRNIAPEQREDNIRMGLAECLRTGTTLVGDISESGASHAILCSSSVRAVVFRELLGLTDERATLAWTEAEHWLNAVRPADTCRPGLSPHAPYSVRASLIERVAERARRDAIPVSIHLAESREEIELLQQHSGPFVTLLTELGVWDPSGLVRDCAELVGLNQGVSPLLLAHGTYLDAKAPLRAGASVVYCPRTHAAFGQQRHPFREMLQQGVRVALGTDSLASNPDLSIWEEVRFLYRQHPDLPGEDLLRMATLSGAEALGWAEQSGSLEPGKSADIVVLPLRRSAGNAFAQLFESNAPVRSVMFRGRWVHGST
jgi:aminodeoxyfutalosine deaminase